MLFYLIIILLILIYIIFINFNNKETFNNKENFNDSVILARPNYTSLLTPRFDSHINSGVIRGTSPPLNQTAVHMYPLTPSVEQNRENFYEKIKKIYYINNKMSYNDILEPIDEPVALQNNKLSDLANSVAGVTLKNKKETNNNRPDLSYQGAELPKLGIDNQYKDPTNPSNYMYDRTLFAPLKRRYAGVQTDYIRGDVYVAPNRFGWFDVPSNPGTDLNPGFFNLNYPSYESNINKEDTEVVRTNKGITLQDLENIQNNNPFSINNLHRV